MNEFNLKNLIGGSRRQREDAMLPDASSLTSIAGDEPVSLAQRRAARIAESGRNADLYRFARDLQPFSEQLGRDLRAQFAEGDRIAAHRITRRSRRSSRQVRAWRWLAAAACLALVAGLWGTHHYAVTSVAQRGAAMTSTAVKKVPDRIFAAFEDKAVAVSDPQRDDTIFRSDFRSREVATPANPQG